RRYIVSVKTARESEVVNPPFISLVVLRKREVADLSVPLRVGEIDRLLDRRVPSAANNKESWILCPHTLNGSKKIEHKNDVAIHITNEVVPGDRLRLSKHVVEAIRPKFAALDMRFIPNAQLLRRLGRSFVVAEKNHLDIRMQQRPTFQGVPLNDADVPAERFCSSKER